MMTKKGWGGSCEEYFDACLRLECLLLFLKRILFYAELTEFYRELYP
jgi:hypothetical protein